MPDTIPSLWPPEFKIDVQTPYTILKVQAGLLSRVTRGILQGDVESESSKDAVQHRLVVIAPAYNGYRHTLLAAVHQADLPYPAEIRAQSLGNMVQMDSDHFETTYPSASSDEEMQKLVSRALHSEHTKAIIHSLIAKSNEARVSASAG